MIEDLEIYLEEAKADFDLQDTRHGPIKEKENEIEANMRDVQKMLEDGLNLDPEE
jgi:RecB family endonuclease NucS